MDITLNLLKSRPYDDGKRRYIGMHHTEIEGCLKGGPEAIFQDPEKLFDSLRKDFGVDIKILVKSESLPRKLTDIPWFKGRETIDNSELSKIIADQQRGGYKVELAA